MEFNGTVRVGYQRIYPIYFWDATVLTDVSLGTGYSVTSSLMALSSHCESGSELWLQGEAALQTQNFRDAEPKLGIRPKTKKNHGVPPVQLRSGINICLTTSDPCLPIIVCKCNDSYCSWSIKLVPSNLIGKYFLFIRLFLALWLSLKMCSENRLLVVLLQIGAKDLTVCYLYKHVLHCKLYIVLQCTLHQILLCCTVNCTAQYREIYTK